MSFALSLDNGRLEWGSHSLGSVFAQRSNVVSPAFWGMVSDVLRFNKEAPKVLDDPAYANMTLGEYLAQQKYSEQFQQNYVLPMCAAVWSVPSSQVRSFPLVALVRFWVNHHLLQVTGRPVWRVVKGRSKSYVDAILKCMWLCVVVVVYSMTHKTYTPPPNTHSFAGCAHQQPRDVHHTWHPPCDCDHRNIHRHVRCSAACDPQRHQPTHAPGIQSPCLYAAQGHTICRQ